MNSTSLVATAIIVGYLALANAESKIESVPSIPCKAKLEDLPNAAFGNIHDELKGVHFDDIHLEAPSGAARASLSVWGVRLLVDMEWAAGGFEAALDEISGRIWKKPKHTPLGKSYISILKGAKRIEINVSISEISFKRVSKTHFDVIMRFAKNSELDRHFGRSESHSVQTKMKISRN